MSTQTLHTPSDATIEVTYRAYYSGDGWNDPRTFELDIDTITVDGKELPDAEMVDHLAAALACTPGDAMRELEAYLASNHEPDDDLDHDPWTEHLFEGYNEA